MESLPCIPQSLIHLTHIGYVQNGYLFHKESSTWVLVQVSAIYELVKCDLKADLR